MINLLPPETKRQIRAARMNVTLYKYCLLIIATAALLGGVFAVGFLADLNDRRSAETYKTESEAAAAPYAKTKAQAEDFAKDLATGRTILTSNVSFSKLVLDIAAVVPSGVILNNLSLGTTAKADTPIDISARTSSYDGAVALKNSLEASPIFEQVNIINISQADLSAQVSELVRKYPFAVSIKAKKTPVATQGASS
jgi:Tfp pilus assembly protein PilN